jgi:uracil-DNA glycosylase
MSLYDDINACRICRRRFLATKTGHAPAPIVWFEKEARILIAGQAPGARAHASGKPFTDASGERLRDWLDIDTSIFYDTSKVAIVPMAFCFPGYNAKGGDLPPPNICAKTWRLRVMEHIGEVRLTVLLGAHAQSWHFGKKTVMTDTVMAWRDHAPCVFSLPHPSWRNNSWIKKNIWFEADLLPTLRSQVKEALK